MSRLPVPGADTGTWGNILNDFLGQSHNPDGTLKDSALGSSVVIHSAGDENISGVKTFQTSPVVPAPTLASQAATKAYVDAEISANSVAMSDSGTWSAANAYTSGEVVSYGGARYVAPAGAPISAFFDTSKWVMLGALPDSF